MATKKGTTGTGEGRDKGRKAPAVDLNPEKRRVTERQALYLERRTGVKAAEIAKLTVGDLRDRLEWHLDPRELFYQKVCGRVVRRDPVTGELHPVPYATVHVEDTDCNFLFYAPPGYGYVWLYPGFCQREEVAAVQADECGNFCVWIPRWEIDRVLRWRLERVCFPELVRPRIVDLLDDLLPIPEIPRPPIPLPDPPPDFADLELRREVAARVGDGVADRLALLAPDRTFGAFRGAFDQALLGPAPRELLPRPPAPDLKKGQMALSNDARLEAIDLKRPLGPYRICRDILVPEWQVIVDVPDITFRVTQDQGGSEVTIYDEGYFDVRWNDTSIPDTTLEVWPNAQWVDVCDDGPGITCEDEPAVLNVSIMPLTAGYHDNTVGDLTFGYGLRVNQPSPDGINAPTPGPAAGTAHAPHADRLDLYGCFHIAGSSHYRVMARFEGGAPTPITGVSFAVLTSAFTIDYQVPDADGWYPIRNDLISSYEHLILPWPSQQSRFADGSWELVLEVGSVSGGGIGVDAQSATYTFELDNSTPVATFHQIRWWHEDDGPGTAQVLPMVCPVLARTAGKNVIVEVTWSASAAHLRSASAGFGGCGGGNPTPLGVDADRQWYWQTPGDATTGVKVTRWRIPDAPAGSSDPSLPAGCYRAALHAASRAYNPAVPGASTTSDWYVSEARRRTDPSIAISVVDV